jgi:hypothetical protein
MALALAIVPQGFEEAARLLKGIKNGFPKAASEAINRGLIAGRKVAAMGIRQRYNIKSGDVKGKGMVIKRSTAATVSGTLEASGPMLPVALFAPRTKAAKGKRRTVSVMIIKGRRKVIKGAFMTPAGKVKERRQPDRYPIFTVSTIGVPFMVSYQGISSKVQETIAKATADRLAHNVALFTSGAEGRAIAARIGSKPKL